MRAGVGAVAALVASCGVSAAVGHDAAGAERALHPSALAGPAARVQPTRRLLLHEPAFRGWSVVDIARRTRERVVRAGYFGITRSRDGSRLAFPCRWPDPRSYNSPRAVCVVRLDRAARATVIEQPDGRTDEIGTIGWAPDGRRLLYTRSSADPEVVETWVSSIDGANQRRLVAGAGDGPGRWAPRGALVAFGRDQPGPSAADGMYVVDANNGTVRQVTRHPATAVGDPVWSPDGSKIAYALNAPDTRADGLYVVRADGTQRRRIAPFRAWNLTWSADSRTIAYRDRQVTFVVAVATGRRTRLGEGEAHFSPRGGHMLFITEDRIPATGYRGRIHVIKAGSRRRSAVAVKALAALPYVAWSPRGDQIAYLRQNGLWIVDIASRKTRRVLTWALPAGQYKGPLLW